MTAKLAGAPQPPSSLMHPDANTINNTNAAITNTTRTRSITARAAEEFLRPSSDTTTCSNCWRSLPMRLERLVDVLKAWSDDYGSTELTGGCYAKDPNDARRLAMTAAIMASPRMRSNTTSNSSTKTTAIAAYFLPSFEALFRAAITERIKQNRLDEENYPDEAQRDQDFLDNKTPEDELFGDGKCEDIFRNLRTLGWVTTTAPSSSNDNKHDNGLLMQPLCAAMQRTIMTKVRATIEGEYDNASSTIDMDVIEGAFLPGLEVWCDSNLMTGWLCDVLLERSEQHDASAKPLRDYWLQRLNYCVAECFCQVRIEEIFDIVCDFPDSKPAVAELQKVLQITNMHAPLGDALRQSLVKRLNHPGANTSQIIDCYINTIKVLREIDPSDRLLEVVTEPVRSYLRGRNDTVRCIITSLTDAAVGGDLYDELRRQDAKPLETVRDDSDDEEECPTFDWQPAPSITNPKGSFLGSSSSNSDGGGGKAGGGGDILAMLVSIYGSKELFVNEYRVMLADKLLANLDYNTDKEVHTLELLKLRFGELSMRNCEIMIKDMDDSKRALSNIRSNIKAKANASAGGSKNKNNKEPVVDAAVISHIFWPTLQNDQLKHHPRIQSDLDQFSAEFCRLKNPRRLVWLNQLGTVKLELDVADFGPDGKPSTETREFNCSPLLATLISHFEDREQWTAEDLSNETGIAEHIIQKRMGYWVSNRVVKIIVPSAAEATTVIYQVASHEHLLQGEHDVDSAMMDLDHGDSQAVSLFAQEEEEMGVFESYIVGMLTNLGQLPLEKIYSMLKMYTSGSDVSFNKTPQQLSTFLKHLSKQEKLECGPDGMYKLLKK